MRCEHVEGLGSKFIRLYLKINYSYTLRLSAASPRLSDPLHEAADLLYFLMVVLADRGVAVDDVFAELRRRDRRVTRRGGDRKPAIADRIGGAR